jgi:hypothetical protein
MTAPEWFAGWSTLRDLSKQLQARVNQARDTLQEAEADVRNSESEFRSLVLERNSVLAALDEARVQLAQAMMVCLVCLCVCMCDIMCVCVYVILCVCV